MKISEIITDKYKLRIPPTVYYDLLADVREAEEEQELKIGHWIKSSIGGAKICSICQAHMGLSNFKYCLNCGAKMTERGDEK